jgi:hypothetical protein
MVTPKDLDVLLAKIPDFATNGTALAAQTHRGRKNLEWLWVLPSWLPSLDILACIFGRLFGSTLTKKLVECANPATSPPSCPGRDRWPWRFKHGVTSCMFAPTFVGRYVSDELPILYRGRAKSRGGKGRQHHAHSDPYSIGL